MENVKPSKEEFNKAISVLIQAARIGQSRGAYSLEDAAQIASAINFFRPVEAPKTELVDENDSADDNGTASSK